MKNITVILPAYNEEVTIGSMVLGAKQHADRVVVIDDGSTDRTFEFARLAGAEVIRHVGNKGAELTGFGIKSENGMNVIVTNTDASALDRRNKKVGILQ
ncbi:MAG: glycosyltransferase [Candidatus Methanoperedens sp.]|nr:glycosyltransferase [Candidatus Methanoperedens sp.]